MRARSCAGALQRACNTLKTSASGSVTEVLHRPAVVLARQAQRWPEAVTCNNSSALFWSALTLLPPALARSLRSSAWALASMEVKVPQMGESVSEGTIAAILKKPGDGVKEDDIIAQIETDKVTVDCKYSLKEGGVLTHVMVAVGDTVSVGQVVAQVDQGKTPESSDKPKAKEAPSQETKPKESEPKQQPKQQQQPKQEAKQEPKHDTKQSKPEQPHPEPENKAPAMPSEGSAPPKIDAQSKPSPAPQSSGRAPGAPPPKPERRVKMTRLRLRVAERLKGAQNTYAMLTTFNEIDMTALMDMRNAYKDTFLERHGVKLGFMSAFVRAAAEALREVPSVNAVIDGDEIVYRDYVDISIAVATPKGLVVPVLRNADNLSFAGIEKSLAALGKKAREGTISIDDMAGGTFTISNGGVYGSMMSTPIINPPQSAIMGMHAINQRAMVMPGGKIEARPVMYVALTYDHRLIDGREAVTFLKKVKEVVEDPRRILLDA